MTQWFTQRMDDPTGAGIRVVQGADPEELGDCGLDADPCTLLVMADDALPDWVKEPDEIGGQVRKVLGMERKTCPLCFCQNLCTQEDTVRTLKVEGDLWVAHCRIHGFLWYILGPKTSPEGAGGAGALAEVESER